ncbi:MAG: MFS transporter [Acidobacteriota bacterium]
MNRDPSDGSAQRIPLDSRAGRWVLAGAVLGSAVAMLTGTVVNVALPAIGEAFDAGTSDLQWVLNGYLLSLASLILVGGALGDRFGRRKLFVVGTAAFAITSAGCGLAPSIEWLIGLRVLQGVAAALLMPESLAILEAVLEREDRGRAIGAWSALTGVAGAVGPLVGGMLVDLVSWRWAFFLNLPFAAAALWIAVRWIPETRAATSSRLDVRGALSAFLALGALTWTLIQAPRRGLGEPSIVLGGLLGLVAFALFLGTQWRGREPMMPLRMFARPQFGAANAVTFVVYSALGGVFFFLVVFLQTTLGFSAVAAGASLLPITVLMLGLSSKAGDFAQRRGARTPLTIGAVLIAAGLALMTRLDAGSTYLADVLPAIVVFGLGLSAMVAPVTSAVLAAAEEGREGVASGINNALSRTAQLIAVATVPWIAGLEGGDLVDAAAMAAGFPRAMLVLAVVAAAGGLLAWLTISSAPLGTVEPACDQKGKSHYHCAVDATPLREQADAA